MVVAAPTSTSKSRVAWCRIRTLLPCRWLYLPHDYVLNVSKPYLGKFISMSSDWNPLKHYSNAFHGYNQPQLDTSDPWQFKNFLITEGDWDRAFDRIRDTRTPIEVSVASVPAEGSGRIQCLRQRNNHSSRLSDVTRGATVAVLGD